MWEEESALEKHVKLRYGGFLDAIKYYVQSVKHLYALNALKIAWLFMKPLKRRMIISIKTMEDASDFIV